MRLATRICGNGSIFALVVCCSLCVKVEEVGDALRVIGEGSTIGLVNKSIEFLMRRCQFRRHRFGIVENPEVAGFVGIQILCANVEDGLCCNFNFLREIVGCVRPNEIVINNGKTFVCVIQNTEVENVVLE